MSTIRITFTFWRGLTERNPGSTARRIQCQPSGEQMEDAGPAECPRGRPGDPGPTVRRRRGNGDPRSQAPTVSCDVPDEPGSVSSRMTSRIRSTSRTTPCQVPERIGPYRGEYPTVPRL